MIGKWHLLTGCDSCAVFEFEDGGILKVSDIYDDEPTIYNYQVFRNNTVEISGSIDDGIFEIITHSEDTIEIMDFSLSGYPEYRNTKLKRMYDPF